MFCSAFVADLVNIEFRDPVGSSPQSPPLHAPVQTAEEVTNGKEGLAALIERAKVAVRAADVDRVADDNR